MMPKRVAETDPNKQISDYTGSGPFVFKQDEWSPGDKAVYVKYAKYKPRAEPASGLAGGKVAKVDRVEWIWIADQQTQVNALLAGEIDFIEQPPHDLLPLLAAGHEHRAGRRGTRWATSTRSASTRCQAVRQSEGAPGGRLRAQPGGLPAGRDRRSEGTTRRARRCSCAARRSSRPRAWTDMLESNFAKSQALLKEAGYDGTPIVLLQSTDLQVLTQSRAGGEVAAWRRPASRSTCSRWTGRRVVARRAKKDPPSRAAGTRSSRRGCRPTSSIRSSTAFLNASCDKATFGWPCDAELEKLRDDFARETDPGEAEGDRRGGAGALDAVPDARASRPVVPARRVRARTSTASSCAGVGVLEHQQDSAAKRCEADRMSPTSCAASPPPCR